MGKYLSARFGQPRDSSDRQKNDNITLGTISEQCRDRRRCYRLPALGSIQAEAEKLPRGDLGVRAIRGLHACDCIYFLCTSNGISLSQKI